MIYKIRVRGHLDSCWFDWFDGWEVSNLENGEALLTSASTDQAALHGALNTIRDLNLTLIAVAEVKHSAATTKNEATDSRRCSSR